MTKLKIKTTPRFGLIAPKGYSLASIDFSAQEAMIAAYYSEDPQLLEIFNAPIFLEDGKTKNPKADIHCINAMNCTHPWLFKNVPLEKQVSVAKDASLITEKGCSRDYAKILLYGVQYMQGAQGMSELHHIPVKTAQNWIENHQETFPLYHKWVAEEKHLAETRGWSQTPGGFTRMVLEDNAKAQGASPGRSGVNQLIQSFGAEMALRSLHRIFQELDPNRVKLVNAIHDEILLLLPGESKLDWENSKISERGELEKPKFIVPDQTFELAQKASSIMENVEEKMFEGLMKGRSEIEIAPYWSH